MQCDLCENLISIPRSPFKCAYCNKALSYSEKEKYFNRLLLFSSNDNRYKLFLDLKKNDKIYKKCLEKYIKDVYYSRNPSRINSLAFFFFNGYGTKRSPFLGEILFNYATKIEENLSVDPDNPCPICLADKDMEGELNICSTCGNMICGYCFYKIKERSKNCPACRENLFKDHRTKVIELETLLTRKRGERIEPYIKFFLSIFYIYSDEMRNFDRAYHLLTDIISKYHWIGMALYGILYMGGHGVKKNTGRGFGIYRVGAKKGNYRCLGEMGRCYRYGVGVKKNKKRSISCYTKAAENGDYRSFQTLEGWRPEKNNGGFC
jgi:hypothetical protein